jgi:hypothetical protein
MDGCRVGPSILPSAIVCRKDYDGVRRIGSNFIHDPANV